MVDNPRGFSPGRVGRLIRKELNEILRDRRTVLTLVGMPLLLYPLMSVVFQQFLLESKVTGSHGSEYHIGFSDPKTADTLGWLLGLADFELAKQKIPDAAEKKGAQPKVTWKAHIGSEDDIKSAMKEGRVDLFLEVSDPARLPPTEQMGRLPRDFRHACTIYFQANSATSLTALSQLERRLAAVNALALSTRLDLPNPLRHPRMVFLDTKRQAIEASESAGAAVSLSALVPLILILMTITGAVYPAIDLTAGERERGTLEMLMVAPVSRFELLGAKYVAVVAVAMLTALVNLLSMFLTLQLSGLGTMLLGEQGLSLGVVVSLLGLLALFAGFFSAVLLALTSFARSFKEAQAYLIPLMLASLTPGVVALMPGIELKGVLTVAPLVNIVLLARDLFDGKGEIAIALLVVLTTFLYAGAAIGVAARIFGAENVLYNEQSTWSDLWRRPAEPRPAASLGAALGCLALMVPTHFVLQWLVRISAPLLDGWQVWALAGVNFILFAGLPAWTIYLGRVQPTSGLRLVSPRWSGWLAGMFLGASLWPLIFWVSSFQKTLIEFPQPLADAAAALRGSGASFFVLVISAAVLEELFFRGLLFQSLRTVLSGGWTAIVTGLLFGVTHVFFGGALGLERLIPSTMLGLILGGVCWRTGSLWPGMLLHVLHNTILVYLSQSGLAQQDTIPTHWLIGGAVGTMLGVLLILWTRAVAPAADRRF